MPDMKNLEPLPGAHYGTINEEEIDPDSELPDAEHMDEDNDEDHPTDPALIEMLGFDPDDWKEEDDETETVKNKDGSISKRKKV